MDILKPYMELIKQREYLTVKEDNHEQENNNNSALKQIKISTKENDLSIKTNKLYLGRTVTWRKQNDFHYY